MLTPMKAKNFDSLKWLTLPWLPVGFLLLTLSVIIWGPVIVLSGVLNISGGWMKFLVRSWVMLVPKYFFIRHKVYYPPNFKSEYPEKDSVIVVSNHQSLIDIPYAYYAVPGNIRMLAKASLFKIPIFGLALRAAGNIEIVRGSRGSGKSALDDMKRKLRSGIQIWLAPEGTRSRDWHLGAFKPGAFSLALDLERPVQPIVMLNACEILPKGSLWPKVGGLLEIQVLPIVDPKKLGITDRVALSQHVWNQMNAALVSYWQGRA